MISILPHCIFYRRDTLLLERLQERMDVFFLPSHFIHERTLFGKREGNILRKLMYISFLPHKLPYDECSTTIRYERLNALLCVDLHEYM